MSVPPLGGMVGVPIQAEARRWGAQELDDGMNKRGSQVATEVADRATRRMPRTTDGLESALDVVKARLRPRRGLFSNRNCMNCRLDLMLLYISGAADDRRRAAATREVLITVRGRPNVSQAMRNDQRGTPSPLADAGRWPLAAGRR